MNFVIDNFTLYFGISGKQELPDIEGDYNWHYSIIKSYAEIGILVSIISIIYDTSVTLDFSWNQFINILMYKMEQKGKYLILIDRFFPSSKMCSACGYINNQLKLKDRKWCCPACNTEHERDINASINIRNRGLEILKENNIKIIKDNNDTTVGTTGFAFRENIRLINQQFSRKKEATCL